MYVRTYVHLYGCMYGCMWVWRQAGSYLDCPTQARGTQRAWARDPIRMGVALLTRGIGWVYEEGTGESNQAGGEETGGNSVAKDKAGANLDVGSQSASASLVFFFPTFASPGGVGRLRQGRGPAWRSAWRARSGSSTRTSLRTRISRAASSRLWRIRVIFSRTV